jgi:uncharacterized protein YjaZ
MKRCGGKEMTVIRTDKWLLDLYRKPLEICERLTFNNIKVDTQDIYDHLVMNGMYRPYNGGESVVKDLIGNNVWEIVHQEEKQLRKLWGGPSVPIYIFPSDKTNPIISKEYNGKSGLAFNDKLFLFLSEQSSKQEIQALFTHEYNHVCRLKKYKKQEKDYTLGDSIILEGLAENAVKERYGREYLAPYISYYSDVQLERMWNKILKPKINVKKSSKEHDILLFGQKFLPAMVGYCMGYHIVSKKLKESDKSIKDVLSIETEEFLS